MLRLSGLIIALLLPLGGTAAPSSAEQQRQWFAEARQALDKSQMQRFASLAARLRDYPLYPYLELWQARQALDEGRDEFVARILARHADIPEVVDLRLAWIKSLAKRGQWPHVAEQLQRYPAAAANLPEIAMLALWRTGHQEEAMRRFSKRWQQGTSTSDMAYALERAWMKSGHPDSRERLGRIAALAKQGRWQAVQELAEPLSEAGRAWLGAWRRLQRDPAAIAAQWPRHIDAQTGRAMLDDVLRRLARRDVHGAWQAIGELHDPLLNEELRNIYRRRVALRAARQHLPEAANWLARLPASVRTADTRAWLVRLHLLAGNDKAALAAIRAMPDDERRQSRWLYWQARTLEHLGRQTQAKTLYAKLAGERGYYSFLSAEHLARPYHFADSVFEVPENVRRQLAGQPAMRRAREWWLLGEAGKANREWYLAMRRATADEWRAAAALARDWGWYDRMIYSTYRAGETDALAYRFPKGFAEPVQASASMAGLTPSLIWSVIRQESAFNPRAVSRSGACGLMQLMPATAQHVARQHRLAIAPDDLFDAGTNIRLGSMYLSSLNERFSGNVALMAAAYNAGPNRVAKWLEHTPFEHRAAWIEAIPFSETRRYVQQVLAFMIVYDWLQAKTPTPLGTRLASIGLQPQAVPN